MVYGVCFLLNDIVATSGTTGVDGIWGVFSIERYCCYQWHNGCWNPWLRRPALKRVILPSLLLCPAHLMPTLCVMKYLFHIHSVHGELRNIECPVSYVIFVALSVIFALPPRIVACVSLDDL